MLRTSFLLQKLQRGSNSVRTGDRVTVLAFCNNSPHGPLSVYQVSLNYLEDFMRYAPEKKFDGRTGKQQLNALPSERESIKMRCK